MSVRIFTIGFAKTTAEHFFTTLQNAGVKRIIDVRLNNTSQLAGFSKKDDLRFFLREVGGIEYIHLPELAPTQEILDAYKKHKGSWAVFEQAFGALMCEREVEKVLSCEIADFGCFLCSEKKPDHCHRRLVVEYLQKKWTDASTTHLL